MFRVCHWEGILILDLLVNKNANDEYERVHTAAFTGIYGYGSKAGKIIAATVIKMTLIHRA